MPLGPRTLSNIAIRLIMLACLLGVSACNKSSGGTARVEIASEVTADTLIASGSIATFPGSTRDDHHTEPSMTIGLNVPDGSKVVQFKNPLADIVFYCTGSEQTFTGLKCHLSARDGTRSFTFAHKLTSHQQQTLQRVVVTRVYDGKDR